MIIWADFIFGLLVGGLIVAVFLGHYLSVFYIQEIRKLMDKLFCEKSVDDNNIEELLNQKEILSDKNRDLMDDNFGLESEVEWCMNIIHSKNNLIANRENEIIKLKKEKNRLYENNRRLVSELLSERVKESD